MVMSVVDGRVQSAGHPELTGARVLITGLEAHHGVDIVRAFAEQGCRLVLQSPAIDTALEILLEVVARDAQDVAVCEADIFDDELALRVAQWAAGAFGGLDVVINLARLDDEGLEPDASAEDIEDRLAATLGPSFRIMEVVARRMELTWKEGLILNVVTQRGIDTPAAAELGRIARAALAALTRQEAARWAPKSVRVNAVVPATSALTGCDEDTSDLASEPRIGELALRLASRKGSTMSGLTFDAAPISARTA